MWYTRTLNSTVSWVIHFNGKKRYSSVSPFKSIKLSHWHLWKSTSAFHILGIETEVTQTLGAFILGGLTILNWIPDTAVCPSPGDITNAGGLITAHLWRTKNREGTFLLHFLEHCDKCKRDMGPDRHFKKHLEFLKTLPQFWELDKGEIMYGSNTWITMFQLITKKKG